MAEADPALPQALQSTPRHFAYVMEDGQARLIDAARARDEPRGDTSLLWVHLHGPDDECQTWLGLQDDIPETVRGALVANETRPRCEPIEDGALINLRGLGDADTTSTDPLVSVRMWVQQGRVVSVVRRSLHAVDFVRGELQRGRIRDPGDLVAAIGSAISTELDPVVAELGDKLDELETGLAGETAFELRRDSSALRAQAIAYRRFVSPDRDAMTRLADLPFSWFDERDRVDLKDAADRFARMTEELEAVRERAALMHEQLTDLRAERVEGRMLVVSILALVFLPLTFITGLIGMNVEGIPFAQEPWAFWAITGLCIFVAAAILIYFRRGRWFSG